MVAAGPVGFTAATEAPRLELTMGWPPASLPVAGYLNFVASYGIVTNGMMSQAPCQTNITAFSVSTGTALSSPNTFASGPGRPQDRLHRFRCGKRQASLQGAGVSCALAERKKVGDSSTTRFGALECE